MKCLADLRSIIIAAAIVLLHPAFIAGHISAASTITHKMPGSSHHSKSQSSVCISLCTTATLKDEEETKLSFEEQDDELFPAKNPPFFSLNDDNFIPKKLTSSYLQKQLVFRPPDLVKLYSNYQF